MTIDDDLLAEAKQVAAKESRTLSAFVEDAIREVILRRRSQTRRPVDLPTFGGGGLQPGVDINDSAALWDLLDEDQWPSWKHQDAAG